MRRYLVSGAILAALAIAALTSRGSHAQDDPLSEPPNVEWSLKDSLTACPAGDSVVAGHPSRLRITVSYTDCCSHVKNGVPPDSIWATVDANEAGNARINDETMSSGAWKVFAVDSTRSGATQIEVPSFSGCGSLTVHLYVSGVAQGTKVVTVRTTDTNADGRVTSSDLTSLCDLNYNGTAGDHTDSSLVNASLEHWRRNALHGTLVRRTDLCETCRAESTGTLGESEIFWSPGGKRISFTIHVDTLDAQGAAPCQVFLVRSDPSQGDTLRQFSFPDSLLHDYDPSWSPLGGVDPLWWTPTL